MRSRFHKLFLLPLATTSALVLAAGCQTSDEELEPEAEPVQAGGAMHRGETSSSSDPQVAALRQLQKASATTASLRFTNGFPRFVGGSIAVTGVDAVDRAELFLKSYRDLYRQSSEDLRLGVRRVRNDGILEQVTFAQTYKGLPVFGAELLVSLRGERVVATVGSLLTQDLSLETMPAITAADAEKLARRSAGKSEAALLGKTQLMVLDSSLFTQGRPEPRLVYLVVLGTDPGQVFVDALKGEVVLQLPLEHTGALDDYDLDLEDANGTNAKDTNCFSDTTADDYAGDEDGVYYDWQNDSQVNALWKHSRDTYLFYYNTFGRSSYDNDGEQIELYAHSSTTGGASYSPGCDLFQFTDPFVGYDVMVHEFTHAVISETSNLTYMGESGALNESYADIMASLADNNWTMGEGTPNGTIRSLSNPPTFGDPDRYSNLVVPAQPWDTNNNDDVDDNGGVHTNSGIWNRGAHLLAVGGNFNGQTVTGIGKQKMGILYYVVMQSLPASSTMYTARDYTVTAAEMLVSMGLFNFTSKDVCQVRNALAAVELGSGDLDCDGKDNSTDNDDDNDFIPDAQDNCPTVANPGQQESFNDPDQIGDACDPDDDNDGVPDVSDNCGIYNPDQKDANYNFLGDACEDLDLDGVFDYDDNCMGDPNPDQKDSDHDGEGDACDLDHDGDGVTGFSDNCPFVANADQKNSDGDDLGDACDACPETANQVTAWTTGMPELGIPPKPYVPDTDGDGIPDACDGSKFGPDTFIAVDSVPNLDLLANDGLEHGIEVGGVAGSTLPIDLNLCPKGCPEFFPADYRIYLDLAKISKGVVVRIADDTGRAVATTAHGAEQTRLTFAPQGGHRYQLFFHFGADYSREPATFSAKLSTGSERGSSSSTPPTTSTRTTTTRQ